MRISDNISFNPIRRYLIIKGETNQLTPMETRVLKILCLKKNQYVDKEELVKEGWGNDFKESYTSYIEKLINIQNENLSSSKKRGAKSIPEKPSISQRIKLKNLLESSGYTLSIPLEYLNSFDVDCIIKYITTQSIDLGDERIYNYVHKSNLN